MEDFKHIKIIRNIMGVYAKNSDPHRKAQLSYYPTDTGDYFRYLNHGEVRIEVMKDLAKELGLEIRIWRSTFSRQCSILVDIKLKL